MSNHHPSMGRDPKHRGNSQTEYRGEETCRVARAVARLGAASSDIAEALGTDLSTFYSWQRTHIEFSVASKAPVEPNYEAIVRTLMRLALGYSYTTQKILNARWRPLIVPHTVHVPPNVENAHLLLRALHPEVYTTHNESKTDDHLVRILSSIFNWHAQDGEGEHLIEIPGKDGYRITKTMARLGATEAEIAAALGLTLSAFARLRKTNSDVSEALKLGREMLETALERALLQRATGYIQIVERVSFSRAGRLVREEIPKYILPDMKAQIICDRARQNRAKPHDIKNAFLEYVASRPQARSS